MVTFYSPGWGSDKNWVVDLYPLSKPLFTRQPPTTINDLPPELLEEVFAYYVHDSSNETKAPPSSFISAQSQQVVNPFILGHVCKYWMHVSRSRSTLWSSIYITEPSMKHLDMASSWLSLSARSAMTLSLTMGKASTTGGGLETSDPETARRFIDLLLTHYDQWKHITIHISHANYLASGLQDRLPGYSPPKLSYADINYGYGMMGQGPVDDAIVHFYSSPGIDSLAWCAQWYKPASLVSLFPHWQGLKHLTYRQGYSENALTATQAVGLLLGCPLLEHFDAIIHAEHGHGSAKLDDPVVHTHLRVLDLTFHPDLSIHIFDSLSCPALEEANINFVSVDCFGVMQSAEPFLSFLERSACQLNKFSFDNHGAPEDALLDILASEYLQHTKVLQLAGMRTNRAIELLTRSSAVPSSLSILPVLEQFEFKQYPTNPEFSRTSTRAIERMLVSRGKHTRWVGESLPLSPLRYVDLDIGKLSIWGYLRLAKLTRLSVPEVSLPRFAEILKGTAGWMSSEMKFSFGSYGVDVNFVK